MSLELVKDSVEEAVVVALGDFVKFEWKSSLSHPHHDPLCIDTVLFSSTSSECRLLTTLAPGKILIV